MHFTKQIAFLFAFIGTIWAAKAQSKNKQLLPALVQYVQAAEKGFDSIPAERKTQLVKLADMVKKQLATQHQANLLFICTHNSRRSHMGQLWATAAANYYGIKKVHNFSGGTESTAFNPRAVKVLTAAGFIIAKAVTDTASNPKYSVLFATNQPAITAFSKKYTDSANPQSNFIAVMTCSQADTHCPVVKGASGRVAIPYDDPKLADGTPQEAAVYQQRCLQIATEVLYVFHLLKK